MNITYEAFKAAILKYKDSLNVNPYSETKDRCVYIGFDGEHCLIGQVYIDLGGGTEALVEADENGISGGELLADYASVDEEVMVAANQLQSIADGGGLGTIPANWEDDGATLHPRRWNETIKLAIDNDLL